MRRVGRVWGEMTGEWGVGREIWGEMREEGEGDREVDGVWGEMRCGEEGEGWGERWSLG